MTPTSSPRPAAELPEVLIGLLVCLSAVVLCGWVSAGALKPTEAERAARRAKTEATIQERAELLFSKHLDTCGDAPYPSSGCPVWTYGADSGEDPTQIIGVVEAWKDEHPCFPGQVKARETIGAYFEPGDEFYAAATRFILCFDTAADAEREGFHHFED